MTKTLTATEAVRQFSEILNSIKYKGDDYTIVRGGSPIATIRPVKTPAHVSTLGDLLHLTKTIPSLGDEAELFLKDIRDVREFQPAMPEKNRWE